MKRHPYYLLIVLTCLMGQAGWSQEESPSALKVKTSDGNRFRGIVLEETDSIYRLQTIDYDTLVIPKSGVKRTTAISVPLKRYPPEESPAFSRHLFGASGYGPRAGEAHLINSLLIFNHISYGFTDYLSAGLGTTPLLAFEGSGFLYWSSVKFSVPIIKNKLNVGPSWLYFGNTMYKDETMGFLHTPVTIGNRERNISLGAGFRYDEFLEEHPPMISLSTHLRLNPRIVFISENYYFVSKEYADPRWVLQYGLRFIMRRVSLDVHLFAWLAEGEGYGFPWLSASIPLTK